MLAQVKSPLVCDAKHHTAILARAPNIMLRDMNALSTSDVQALIAHVDAVCFGMGLGPRSTGQNSNLSAGFH